MDSISEQIINRYHYLRQLIKDDRSFTNYTLNFFSSSGRYPLLNKNEFERLNIFLNSYLDISKSNSTKFNAERNYQRTLDDFKNKKISKDELINEIDIMEKNLGDPRFLFEKIKYLFGGRKLNIKEEIYNSFATIFELRLASYEEEIKLNNFNYPEEISEKLFNTHNAYKFFLIRNLFKYDIEIWRENPYNLDFVDVKNTKDAFAIKYRGQLILVISKNNFVDKKDLLGIEEILNSDVIKNSIIKDIWIISQIGFSDNAKLFIKSLNIKAAKLSLDSKVFVSEENFENISNKFIKSFEQKILLPNGSEIYPNSLSEASKDVLDYFGSEAPKILNDYAIELEDKYIKTDNQLKEAVELLKELSEEHKAYEKILTDPDTLADYTIEFFGKDGPYPVNEETKNKNLNNSFDKALNYSSKKNFNQKDLAQENGLSPLRGEALLEKISELGDISKSEIVRICGYIEIGEGGNECLNFYEFDKALGLAKEKDNNYLEEKKENPSSYPLQGKELLDKLEGFSEFNDDVMRLCGYQGGEYNLASPDAEGFFNAIEDARITEELSSGRKNNSEKKINQKNDNLNTDNESEEQKRPPKIKVGKIDITKKESESKAIDDEKIKYGSIELVKLKDEDYSYVSDDYKFSKEDIASMADKDLTEVNQAILFLKLENKLYTKKEALIIVDYLIDPKKFIEVVDQFSKDDKNSKMSATEWAILIGASALVVGGAIYFAGPTLAAGAAWLFGKNNKSIAGKDQIQNANTISQGFKNFRSNSNMKSKFISNKGKAAIAEIIRSQGKFKTVFRGPRGGRYTRGISGNKRYF